MTWSEAWHKFQQPWDVCEITFVSGQKEVFEHEDRSTIGGFSRTVFYDDHIEIGAYVFRKGTPYLESVRYVDTKNGVQSVRFVTYDKNAQAPLVAEEPKKAPIPATQLK